MRVWDVHPGYLSKQSLLGQHAEIHAIFSVLSEGREGYSRHPETLRWVQHLDKLVTRHDLTVKEMILRGYNHASPLQFERTTLTGDIEKLQFVDKPTRQFALLQQKYIHKMQCGRIPLPKNSSALWSHYKYSVMGRGYRYYQEIKHFLSNRRNYPIEQDAELIEMVFVHMEKEPTDKSLRNVIDHLRGYFKRVSTTEEREILENLRQKSPDTQLTYLYNLSQKYQEEYLIHSTIFADFVSL